MLRSSPRHRLSESTLDPLPTFTHVTSTPKFVRHPWEIRKMSTDELRHIPCVVCLISSCVNFSLMTKKDFKRNRWVDHATNQTIPGQPSDIQHLTRSTTLLSTSPCAQCSMISRRSFIALRNYPKSVPWQRFPNYGHRLPTFSANVHSADNLLWRPCAVLCTIRGAKKSIFWLFT